MALPAEVIAAALRLVLITDRRLMGRVDHAVARALPRRGGHDVWVTLREHDLADDELARKARAIAALDVAPLMIAGRLDVAMAVDATGVHLPEREPDLAGARDRWEAACGRRNGPVIGASRHSAEGAIDAALAGAHLVQLGPIFATPSKAGMGEPLGLAVLGQVRAVLPPDVVLVAVGGIDGPERAEAAAAAGADAVAVIRAVWTAAEPAATVAELVAAVRRGRARRGVTP